MVVMMVKELQIEIILQVVLVREMLLVLLVVYFLNSTLSWQEDWMEVMDLVIPFQVLMNMKHWIVVDLNLLWVVVMMVKELELHQIWAFSIYNPADPEMLLSLETVS